MNQKVSVMNDGWQSFRDALTVQRAHKKAFFMRRPFLETAYNKLLKEAVGQSQKFEWQRGGITYFNADELHRRFRILNEAGFAESVLKRADTLWKYVTYKNCDYLAILLIGEAEARVNGAGIVKKRKSGEDNLENFIEVYRSVFQLPVSSKFKVRAFESRARVLERFGRNIAAKDQLMRAARIALRGGMELRARRIIASAREKLVA